MRGIIVLALAVLPSALLAETPRTVTLEVRNMTCVLCQVTVRKSLEKLTGVRVVKVDFDHRTATVLYDADRVDPGTLTKATTDAGYPSRVRK